MKTLSLNGLEVPKLGFGTWQLEGDVARSAAVAALEVGYRHIDTAQIYQNEAEVGAAIKESGVNREDIFLTTKVWVANFKQSAFERSVLESLKKLQVEYVDLLLLHWPTKNNPIPEVIGHLNLMAEKGYCKNIGVSNYPSKELHEAMSVSERPILTNQIEYHPFLNQDVLLKLQRQKNVMLTAYCPLAQGKVFESELINNIAKRHNKSAAQVTLKWLVEQEPVVTIPRSSNPVHIKSNFDIFDFDLSDDEMKSISDLTSEGVRLCDPGPRAPKWDV